VNANSRVDFCLIFPGHQLIPLRYYVTVVQAAVTSWIQLKEVEIREWTDVVEDFEGGYLGSQKGGGY